MDEGLGKEPEKKKINEDLVMFMRKRTDNDAPRYTARLKTYVDIQRKKARARGTYGDPMSASNWMFGLMNVFDRRRRAGIARRVSEGSDHKGHKQQDPTEKEDNKSEHPGSDEDGTRSKTSIIKASAKGLRGQKPQIISKSQHLLISGWFTGGGRKDAGGKERKHSKSKSQTDDDMGMERGIQYAKRDVSGGKEDKTSAWEISPLKRFLATMCRRRRRRRSCCRRRRRRRSCRRRRRRRSCRRRRRRRSCRRRRRRRSCRRRRRRRC